MSIGGLSRNRLTRMHDVLAEHVRGGRVPGLVSVVSRRGETQVDAIGSLAADGRTPMSRDALFRIASLTKPITAVATMILIEECAVRLDDPAQQWLPELADRQVLTRPDGPLPDTVPATRPITVRDLLTFRLGWGQLMGRPEDYPILAEIRERDLLGFGPPSTRYQLTPDEWLARLAELPLMHQPGEQWLYNTGSYLLGVLVARVSGQPFETFLARRVFEPLGMRDTAFHVPPDKLDRLATGYQADPVTGELRLDEFQPNDALRTPPTFPDGAAGLVSTVDDYLAFGRMMLNLGRCDGERILSRPTVQAMITDQLTPAQKAVSGFGPTWFASRGWGLGVSVTTERASGSAVPGQFGWDGGAGTTWYCDPAEDLIAILFTQRGGFPLMSPVYQDFWTLVYQAIDD